MDEIIGIPDAINSLRAALADAIDRGRGSSIRFEVEPVELTMQAVITKDANGRIGWGALGIGGSYSAATTQTLKLNLRPLMVRPDGSVTSDFTIADDASAPQRFGPRDDPAAADE
ncbi:trypco2 family protein [Paractinoplanes rhizophilus]|uniref:Trypco2 family protein n=1 Tax=Paractinoplanes rhizophilus TaxID=1416877 RepID=A0ABW2I4M8_9ACTN